MPENTAAGQEVTTATDAELVGVFAELVGHLMGEWEHLEALAIPVPIGTLKRYLPSLRAVGKECDSAVLREHALALLRDSGISEAEIVESIERRRHGVVDADADRRDQVKLLAENAAVGVVNAAADAVDGLDEGEAAELRGVFLEEVRRLLERKAA